jgi:hypothetical protein
MNLPTQSSDYLAKLLTYGACTVKAIDEEHISSLLEGAKGLAFRPRESRKDKRSSRL